jgi:glycosyltransferase involved in cell wall biosynthesis
MRILMLSVTFPYPPSKGGTQVRTFNLLKTLQSRHQITLVTQQDASVKPEHLEALKSQVEALKVFPAPAEPSRGAIAKFQRFSQSWLTGIPPNVTARQQPEMAQWIATQVAENSFDVLTCEHSVNEIFVRLQWRSRLRTVVNIHSSISATAAQQLTQGTAEHPWRDRVNLPLLKRYEKDYCRKFSHLVVTTPEDAVHFHKLAPNVPISVIPNGVDLEIFTCRDRDPGGTVLIFAGAMDNQPNIDAARFLSLEIFPKIRAHYPDATLRLVGARPVLEVQKLAQYPGIIVTGKVPSMVAELHQATVGVIPMRSGFGIKNKTLEALAAGIPIVASDRALEGLAFPQVIAERAVTVDEYVGAIAQFFEHPELRQERSILGRQFIETHYQWGAIAKQYEAALKGD